MTPQDGAQRARDLIALTERLTGLMAAQAQAFEARRPQEAARTLEESGQLSNAYRHESMKVRENPALLAGAPLELRRRLVAATEAFDAVLARHARALNAVKSVTEGLVQAVANEVASQRTSGTGYGPGAKAYAGDARAITLNRQA
jgi:hypothetical protein